MCLDSNYKKYSVIVNIILLNIEFFVNNYDSQPMPSRPNPRESGAFMNGKVIVK